jgi:hypothetical protein
MSDAYGDPAEMFESPREVVADKTLSKDQKLQILETWRQDAKLQQQAEAENMSGGKRPRLQEVKLALAELDNLPPRDDP